MRNKKDDEASLPGYGSYSVNHKEGYVSTKLLLPNHTVQELHAERLAADLAKSEKDNEELRLSAKADEDWFAANRKSRSSLRDDDIDPVQEATELREAAELADRQAEDGRSIVVYDPLEPLKLVQDLKGRTPDREVNKRHVVLYKQIKPKGHRRALAQPKFDLPDFKRLRLGFPHFAPVLDLIQHQFDFAELTEKPFQIPPILLGGDPGIGKTRFTQELADALGTVMQRLPFDNDQHGSGLLGSDKHWSNTTHGLVFELVVLGRIANPIILLDEIDKASKRREGDPRASLHSLLETVTSERVRDISLDFEFNASRVIWIATANELDRIPSSLRSRFQEFWIEQPTGAQALQMAEVVALEVHYLMELPDFDPPTRQLVHYIAHLSAREQIQALKRAYAAAKVDGRHQIALSDLPEQVRREAAEFAGEDIPPAGLLH
jgi:ATP-dependent Lon protease